MDAERIEQAVQRIEAALARIGTVADAPPPAPATDPAAAEELAKLQEKHEHLRATASRVLAQLDETIEGLET